MPQGKPLNAKLFIEGVEVPFTGVTLTYTVNQASIAYFDLVPQKEILNIKPRTLVQVFSRQYQESANEKTSGSERFPYVLAWEGEVFGYSFGKNPASRTFSMSAIDFTGYWDNALTYFFNLEQNLGQGTEISSTGQDTLAATKQGTGIIATAKTEASLYRTTFDKVFEDNPKADLLDAFIEMYRKVAGINEFFADAESRLRITDRFAIQSSGAVENLVRQKEALVWFKGIPNKFNGYTSLRTVIQELMAMIFHDCVTIPFPSKVETKIKNPLKSSGAEKKTVGSYIFKPNLFMMPPPLCNVFFPDEYSSYNFSRNFFEEPTRLIYRPELPGMFGDSNKLYMEQQYSPGSFRNFMTGQDMTSSELKGFVSDNPASSGSELKITQDMSKLKANLPPPDRDTISAEEKKKFGEVGNDLTRNWQFMTNEERIKGIYLAQENMVPMTSSFRSALDEGGNKTEFIRKISDYLFFKKRFQSRQVQITSHLKMSVVPGFPVLILDDQDPSGSVIAYCTSVTHRIYATEGGHTNVTLSYARSVGEQSVASDSAGSAYFIPPWFDEAIFGKAESPPPSEAAPAAVKGHGKVLVSAAGLKTFYNRLLGSKTSKENRGGDPLTTFFKGEPTLLGATHKLAQEYLTHKKSGASTLQEYIAVMTNREYVKMADAFKFLGAESTSKPGDKYLRFDGDIFSRKGKRDAFAVKLKRDVVIKYATALSTKRGFRG